MDESRLEWEIRLNEQLTPYQRYAIKHLHDDEEEYSIADTYEASMERE